VCYIDFCPDIGLLNGRITIAERMDDLRQVAMNDSIVGSSNITGKAEHNFQPSVATLGRHLIVSWSRH
jgi:hypothetical protein